MKNNNYIKILIYLYPMFLVLHLAYGLIVREPYPSFMMPGFSRIDIYEDEYKLTDHNLIFQNNNKNDTITVKQLAHPFSKIAISRAIDLVYFNKYSQKNYNSMQKKYYSIIRSIIGKEYYDGYIINIRNPKISKTEEIEFSNWIKRRISEKKGIIVSQIIIQKILITRKFKSGRINKMEIIDSIKI